MIRQPKCENSDINTIRTSKESHYSWKNHFHKCPLKIGIYPNFEADNEKNNQVVKELIFINKTQYLMVIIYNLNGKMFYKVVIINLL